MRARDQSSIFSTGGKFHPDYGLLLELHVLTLVARSYALLTGHILYSRKLSRDNFYEFEGFLAIGESFLRDIWARGIHWQHK